MSRRDQWNRAMPPAYVERGVAGQSQWLLISDWHWQAWNGCFCRIEDRAAWQ